MFATLFRMIISTIQDQWQLLVDEEIVEKESKLVKDDQKDSWGTKHDYNL